MTIDDVKVLEALFEAARRHGVRRLEVDDVAVEFRADAPDPVPIESPNTETAVCLYVDPKSPAEIPGRTLCGAQRPYMVTRYERDVTCRACLKLMHGTVPSEIDSSIPEHLPIPKPGTGDLCHCGHSKAIEHNHLGCLIGCDEAQCRGEESEAKE